MATAMVVFGPRVSFSADPGGSPSMSRTERLARVAAPLLASVPCHGKLRVAVVQRDGLGAWAWRDGRIQVSPALVDALDDEALMAAVAHELAHLLAGGHLKTADESHALTDVAHTERDADALGCRLLTAVGVAPSAMTRLLDAMAAALGPEGGFDDRARVARSGPCGYEAR